MRETVRDGEPALAVDTEEEFDRVLGSGVYVVPPSWADAMAWHPWDEENTDFLEDVLATDDDPDPTQEDASDPPGWFIRGLWAFWRLPRPRDGRRSPRYRLHYSADASRHR